MVEIIKVPESLAGKYTISGAHHNFSGGISISYRNNELGYIQYIELPEDSYEEFSFEHLRFSTFEDMGEKGVIIMMAMIWRYPDCLTKIVFEG